MPTKGVLAQQNEELRSEVEAKTKAFQSGELTPAEFSEFMDKAEKQSEEIAVGQKAFQRALGFTGSTGPTEDGAPPAVEVPAQFKQYRDGFQRIKEAANVDSRRREAVSFEFGMKSFGDEARMKAQGVSGLMAESTTGTSTPSALSGYFLGGTGGPFIVPEFQPGIVEMKFYENVIAKLIPSYPVNSPVFSYVKETAWTNSAAPTWEGQTKPTSTNAFTRYTEQVGKIANLARTTDELIQDAAYVWSLIQQRLVQGVQRQEEVQLLAGEGMPGVNGLLNRSTGFTKPQTVTAITNLVVPASGTPGIGAAGNTVDSVTPGRAIIGASTGVAPTGIAIAEGVLQAIVDIRVKTFFEPDAIVMNPQDYVTLRLAKDNNGQYFGGAFFGRDYGYPANDPTPNATSEFGLWGKRVVTTPAMPAGLILVGDFADYNSVLRLGGLRVDVTNTNGTDFEQNLWTARAEERVGLVVERPEVFELIQLQNGA